MSTRKDLTKTKFGLLRPVKFLGKRGKQDATYWLCQCDCGKTKEVGSSNLIRGKTISCGCSRRNGEPTSRHKVPYRFFTLLTVAAKVRKLEMNVSFEYIANLFKEQNGRCALSGVKINFTDVVSYNRRKSNRSASLDRIDSSKGYIEGNVHWVHVTPNFMKGLLSLDEFKSWCKKISNNNKETYVYTA